MKQSVRRKFRSGFPILITESNKDFASLRKALNKEIRPNSVIERELVEDYVALTWDIRRCRRVRSEIINSALREALENILKQLLPSDNYENYLEHQRAAEDLACRWLEDREAKTEVIKLLRKFQLDETAIEAEAFRLRGEDLECLDRMLALEMARRDKVIFVLAEYRHTLAKFLQVSDQILEEDETPNLWPWRNVQVDHGKPEADRGEPPQCTKEHRSPFGPWKKARELERLSSRAEQADAGCSVRERC